MIVKVIFNDKPNRRSLVEWREGRVTYRTVVPTESLQNSPEGITHENPRMGLPWGVNWESVEIEPLSASALAQELRNNGIFTVDDLRDNLNTARAIILNLASLTVNKLVKFAQAENNNG